jgi:hypothetical protein
MRASSVEDRAMILEFPTCAVVRFRSDLIASGMSGGNANHDRNATKNATFKKRKWGYSCGICNENPRTPT